MEGKFPSKILVFVMPITHNCDNFFCWSQIFHILSSICEGFILPLQIRFFERAFWVRQKFLVANRHFSCSDFRRDLPKKLLLGLTSLLVSITSMLVSFCAGHYFMLKNKLKDKAFPVYAATSLPIIFFAIQQLPLYVDIVWASFKNVPRSSYKAISL